MRLPSLLPHRRLCLLSLLALSIMGLGRWWGSREQRAEAAFTTSIPNMQVAGRGGEADQPGARPRPQGTTTPVEALQSELAAARQELAQAQQLALDGVSADDQPDALTRFAEGHQDAMATVAALEVQLRDPKINPSGLAPLPAAAAAQARLTAVRRLIVDDGLTLEEAEARLDEAPPR
jgi:hypothetical protein